MKYIRIIPFYVFCSVWIFANILDLFLYSWLSLNIIGFFLGLALMVAGAVVVHATFWELDKFHTTFSGNSDPRTIVTTGPFQFSRNPAYLGMSLFYLGLGFLFANLWVFLSYPFLFLWLNLMVIEREERWLDRLFGEDFYQYKRLVRRWF